MAELVTIPISFFEVAIDYEEPDIRLLGDRTVLVRGLLKAWQEFKPTIDGIEVLSAGKTSEQGLMIKLPEKQIAFFIGASYCRFSRSAVSWELAEDTIRILDLSTEALQRLASVVLGKKRTTMGMHIQPRTRAYQEFLIPFMPPKIANLDPAPFRTGAVIMRWNNGRAVTIDGSGSLANGMFLKLERSFAAEIPYQEIAKQLRGDEMEIFGIMNIEEER